MSVRRKGFTLIELLVVVAIIALLISILLPSLNKARQQAKAAVCSTRLRSYGQASAMYEGRYNSMVPCDPWHMMPENIGGTNTPFTRNPNMWSERVDPSHGWLVRYGMDFKPHIADPLQKPWEAFPYGFRIQSQSNPDDLWEGFFCPSQNLRNTTSESSPELDPFDSHDGYAPVYKYATGYLVNRLLRAATDNGRHPRKPTDGYEDGNNRIDNSFGSAVLGVDIGSGYRGYHVQATSVDELTNAADTMYMCDSLDYRTDPSEVESPFDGGYQSAGMWYLQRGSSPPLALILGARHNGTANVLYGDAHVSRGNQTVRNRRGDLVVASTFADFVESQEIGNAFHAAPTWRHLGR